MWCLPVIQATVRSTPRPKPGVRHGPVPAEVEVPLDTPPSGSVVRGDLLLAGTIEVGRALGSRR